MVQMKSLLTMTEIIAITSVMQNDHLYKVINRVNNSDEKMVEWKKSQVIDSRSVKLRIGSSSCRKERKLNTVKCGQVKRILNCNGHIVKNILYLLCQVEMQIHLIAGESWESGS